MSAITAPGGSSAVDVTAAGAQRRVTGYWLATVPGQGFGIIHGTGPLGGTAHARFLGVTQRELTGNLHRAVAQLGAEQVYEVADGPDKLIQTALSKGSAWAPGPASVSWDTLPTKALAVVLTAAFGGAALGATALGGEAAGGAAAAGGEAAASAEGAGAAAGAAEAESGSATGAAAGGAAGGTAAGAAGKLAKGAAKVVAGNAGKIAAGLTVAGLFTNVSWWKGASMVIAGAVLVILAVRELT